jgi:hypothetical protein
LRIINYGISGEAKDMKRLKGRTLTTALWLCGILSLVLLSGAPNRLT